MVTKYKLVYARHPKVDYDWENHHNEDVLIIGNLLRIVSTNSVSYYKREICLQAARRILYLGNYEQFLSIKKEDSK